LVNQGEVVIQRIGSSRVLKQRLVPFGEHRFPGVKSYWRRNCAQREVNYFWKRFERYKKMRKIFTLCLVLIVAASLNAATITSITANNAISAFNAATGVFQLTGTDGMIQYIGNNSNVTGTFSLNVTMTADTSAAGVASAAFGPGSFSFKDSSNNPLLSGSFTSFNLVEAFPGSLMGNCSFTVNGGSLQGGFGSSGSMMGITFGAPLFGINNFASSFNGYSTMIATSVPEPMTLGILGLGALSILRKRKG
jgi:hypothetical protein